MITTIIIILSLIVFLVLTINIDTCKLNMCKDCYNYVNSKKIKHVTGDKPIIEKFCTISDGYVKPNDCCQFFSHYTKGSFKK